MNTICKRIIPCLDVDNGWTVKGVNFTSIRDAGNPVELAACYAEQGADELVLLDISATNEQRATFLPVVEAVARRVNIPFTVGGGIHSVESAYQLLRAGADKISVNSSAVKRPELISELAERFGRQCVVVAVDVKRTGKGWEVYTHGGRQATGLDALEWMCKAVALGAGELLVTSMDGDGTKKGFDLELYRAIGQLVRVPVIASGGAGSAADFADLFLETTATGGLAASIFHFGEIGIPELKEQLSAKQIKMRKNEQTAIV